MTALELGKRSAANLEATYFAIGGATPDARIERRDGYAMCLGRLDHPVGNFAIVTEITGTVASELALAAKQRASFNIYVPGQSLERKAAKTFRTAGFRKSYHLIQMAAKPKPSKSTSCLCVAESASEQLRVARFMTLQFFARQKASLREQIAEATAGSGLSLYEICRAGEAIGGVMVTREAGVLGIYNLCIESSKRHRGLGSDAVHRLIDQANLENTYSILQADPSLEPWYAGLGFKDTGIVDVFALDR